MVNEVLSQDHGNSNIDDKNQHMGKAYSIRHSSFEECATTLGSKAAAAECLRRILSQVTTNGEENEMFSTNLRALAKVGC